MSRSDWLKHPKAGLIASILSAVLALLLGISVIATGLARDADYQREADNRSREYAAYTNQQIGQRCFPLTDPAKSNCIAEKRQESRKNEREEKDLVAQRKSANWAFIMGAAAVLGMVLSAVGVVLVWVTFQQTRKQAEIAAQTFESFKRVEAPVIDISFTQEPNVFEEKGKEFIRFSLTVNNYGRTTAFISIIEIEEHRPANYHFMIKQDAECAVDGEYVFDASASRSVFGFIEYATAFALRRRVFEICIEAREDGGSRATIHPYRVLAEDDEAFNNPLRKP